MANLTGRGNVYKYLDTAAQTASLGALGSRAVLQRIIIGDGAASAVVTVRETNGSGATIAILDAAADSGSYEFCLDCPNGWHVTLSGGNAKVTIIGA